MRLKKSRCIIFTVAIALLAALALPMAAGAAEQPVEGLENYSSLFVTAEWLKANLKNVVVIDARDPELYKAQGGHIEGAINADPKYFADMNGNAGDPKWHTATVEANMAKRLGALGIDGKREVIVYGDGGAAIANPGWVVWILRMAGNKKARILDGGYGAWRAAGGSTSTKATSGKAVSHPAIKYDASYIATIEQVKQKLEDRSAVVVDIREANEYAGKIRPFGERRPGHIPGAINLPMFSSDLLTDDFTLVPETDIEAALLRFFPDKNAELILYDAIGVRSAFMTLIFRMAGYQNVRSFDAGFHSWWGDSKNEVRQGMNP